ESKRWLLLPPGVAEALVRLGSIRKLVRGCSDIIWLRIDRKLYSLDRVSSLHNRLANSVHAIHDSPIFRQNDGMIQIRFLDQFRVKCNFPAGRHFLLSKPKRLVQLLDL